MRNVNRGYDVNSINWRRSIHECQAAVNTRQLTTLHCYTNRVPTSITLSLSNPHQQQLQRIVTPSADASLVIRHLL